MDLTVRCKPPANLKAALNATFPRNPMTGCLLSQSKRSTLPVDRTGLPQPEGCCDNSPSPVSLILEPGVLLALWCAMPSYAGDARTTSPNQRLIVDLEPHYRASVLRGWRSFQTSYAQDGLACVHCHLGHDSLRPWAGAYPKVQVFDGTPYQVKGLRQVVLEALEKHSDLLPDQRLTLVEDLIAYIVWWGDGQAIKPGHSKVPPPAREDLTQLGSARVVVDNDERLRLTQAFDPSPLIFLKNLNIWGKYE